MSPLSSCDFSLPSDIEFPFDGYCSLPNDPRNTSAYDPIVAEKYLHIAGAAYCSSSQIQTWSCEHCRYVPGFAPKTVITDRVRNLQVFIGYDNDDNLNVISFRGTSNSDLRNWIANLAIGMTVPYAEAPRATVHQGFYDHYTALKPQLMDALRNMPNAPIRITGHSMGGALAAIAAIDLQYFEGFTIHSIFSFGAPRSGNYEYSLWLTNQVPNNWRVTHRQDIVVHVPPQDLNGYYHTAREVHYPDFYASPHVFHVCDGSGEDRLCADSCTVCTSINDHTNYFGFLVGSCL
jgi:hypothetical protein